MSSYRSRDIATPATGSTPGTDTEPRAEPATPAKAPSPEHGIVKVLFFAANADGHRELAADKEYHAIYASIRASRYRDNFLLFTALGGELSDLHQALLDHSPAIVHFACHGNAQAELLLRHADGSVAAVPPAALRASLRALKDNLILVVLNACYSHTQAAAIRDSVGLAIGMERPIDDSAAIAFSAELYRGLASGRSLQTAFGLGVAAIQASSSVDAAPRLSVGAGIDARTFCFAGEAGRSRPAWRRWWWLCGLICAGLVSAGVPRLLQRSTMVQFPAASVRLGVFAEPPPECTASATAADCPAVMRPEQVSETGVEPFELDRLEVTNGEFADWLNANIYLWQPSGDDRIVTTRRLQALPLLRTTKCGGGLTIAADGRAQVTAESAHWPVVCVTWHGANEYCRARGQRLPLETEWELAAKGAEGRPFPWGSAPPQDDDVAYNLRDGAQVHPRRVGSSPRDVSPDGISDLGGNVAEWVEDRRGDLEQKTLRGGSFASRDACHLRSSSCARAAGNSYHKDLGFRCARSVSNQP